MVCFEAMILAAVGPRAGSIPASILTCVAAIFLRRRARNALVLVLAGFAGMAGLAHAQVATIPPKVGPPDRLSFLRAGTFETWQDTSRLGTEFYQVYVTPRRDSVIASTTTRYQLRDQTGPFLYEKFTLQITRAMDAFPLFYQSYENLGERHRALSVTTHDTMAVIFHEAGGRGEGNVIDLPPGRLYLLDPQVFDQVENLVGDFAQRGLTSRFQQVLMPPRDSVVQVRLARGPQETIELPGLGKKKAQRIDLYDDLTLIRTWVSDDGILLKIESPSQGMRVVRLPPGKDEAEAAAIPKIHDLEKRSKGDSP